MLTSGTHVPGWPLAPLGRADHTSLSPSREIPYDGHLEDVFVAPPHLRWTRDALQPTEIQRRCLDRHTCAHIPVGSLRCVTWNTRGFVGSTFSSQLSRERKHNYFGRLTKNNDIICLQEIHGKDEFLHAHQVLAPRIQLFGTLIPNNANAGGSAKCFHKDLMPGDAVVAHVVTCQGRDHIVNIRSGCQRPLRA